MKQFVLPPGSRDDLGVVLRGKDFHYLVHVRRLEKGDRIQALDGVSRMILETISITHDKIEFRILTEERFDPTTTRIHLFPCLLKARKLDDVIRQTCEAGVSTITPIQSDHCISRLESSSDGDKKLLRWKEIAREAAQQSGSANVCEVLPALELRTLPTVWSGLGPLLFFHQVPLAKKSLHRYLTSQPQDLGLIVGPEGGFSSSETDFLQKAGALPVWLGPSVLRAETASLYATAAVQIILQERAEWTIPS